MKRGKRFWRVCRRAFRWTRIGVWLVVLAIIGALLYMNKVGLPGFVKTRVVTALEEQGLNIGFQRLRLQGYRHIVIEQAQLTSTNAGAPIDFLAGRAELKFNRHELKRLRLKIDAVELDDARLRVDLVETNAVPRSLTITNIETQILLAARDRWIIPKFEGETMGARWRFSGTLTNLLSVAEQNAGVTNRSKSSDWEGVVRDVLSTVDKIHFSTPPTISLTALGDLKDLTTFRASLSLRGDSAKSPWGEAQELFFRSSVRPSARPGEQMAASLSIKLKGVRTRWGELKDATVASETLYPLTNAAPFASDWTVKAELLASDWFSGRDLNLSLTTHATEKSNLLTVAHFTAANPRLPVGTAARAQFEARLEHAYPIAALNGFLSDFLPVKPMPKGEILTLGQNWVGDWKLTLANLRTKSATAKEISINGDVRERAEPVQTDGSWGVWKEFADLEVRWNGEAIDYSDPDARVEKIAGRGLWSAPNFKIETIDSQLYGGGFHLETTVDVPSRRVAAEVRFDFDLKKTVSLLDPEVRPILNQFTWERPPKVETAISFTAPAWTNFLSTNAWRAAIGTARLDGSLVTGPSGFRGVTCSELATHFYLTNGEWRLPDLVLKRPEGQLELDYAGRVFETPFTLAIHGGIDPAAALPVLEGDAREVFNAVQFKKPPAIDGLLKGDLAKPEAVSFAGTIAVSNIVVNGEEFLDGRARLDYSNLWINCYEPIAHRTSNEVLTAKIASVDLRRFVMNVTNGFATTDPYRFTKMIGPDIYDAIAPYQFATPPTVRIEGTVPFVHVHDADIHFQIDGEQFTYWRFHMPKASAGVYWHRDLLEVTNVIAKFYGGDAEWEGHFKFNPDDSADYRFKATATNADVTTLLRDLVPGNTNRIEGTLNGTIVITDANTHDLNTWKGHGSGTVKNGFLWDIPIFGIFSPALESVAPGLGRSKIYSGAGSFKIENGKVNTKDMEVRAPAFRLRYNGSVDFDGNLDAKVEAEMFRDTWIVGRAVSAAFWPLAKVLESKVTGNLSAPKSEFAHIPKVMLFPLRPIQTIRDLLPKDKEKEKEKEKTP